MPEVTMEQMIEAVACQKAKWYTRPRLMQPPCPQEEIERLRKEVPARLGTPVPERYLDLLRITNGMSTEGPIVYGSPGIIEENEGMRLDRPNYVRLIFFAYSSLYVHALDIPTGKFVFFPHIGGMPDEVYDTFDQMMISTLWLGLKEEFRPDPWKRTRPRW